MPRRLTDELYADRAGYGGDGPNLGHNLSELQIVHRAPSRLVSAQLSCCCGEHSCQLGPYASRLAVLRGAWIKPDFPRLEIDVTPLERQHLGSEPPPRQVGERDRRL